MQNVILTKYMRMTNMYRILLGALVSIERVFYDLHDSSNSYDLQNFVLLSLNNEFCGVPTKIWHSPLR